MRFPSAVRIDGIAYQHGLIIDRGRVRQRKKKPSKKFRDSFGYTPLSVEEEIPWKCRRLVIGTRTGALRHPLSGGVRARAQLLPDPAPRVVASPMGIPIGNH